MKGTSLFVKALVEEGVDKIFGYPGGSVIDIFDELYHQNRLELILPRHEQAMVHAADGYARATGKVGVCLATSGPGATNLVTGIATANYDSVPLVCFTGQVSTNLIGNDAFQEVDIIGITRSICKYGVAVRDRKDLGRIIKEAFYIARTGKPGPVIIDLPKDIMLQDGDDTYPETVSIRGYKPNTNVHIGQIKKALELLETAKQPILLAGGGLVIANAHEVFTEFVEKLKIPMITTMMGKGILPSKHPLCIGNIGMHGNVASNMAISECDVMLSIGTRFNDRITGKISEFAKNAKIIHVDIDAASISRNIVVDIPIVADAKLAVEKMLEKAEPLNTRAWFDRIKTYETERSLESPMESPMEKPLVSPMEKQIEGRMVKPIEKPWKGLTPKTIIDEINHHFPEAIVVTDVGQHQMWAMQYLEMNPKKRMLTSGGLGTMGYGFPAAIGAKLGRPDKTVLCITGDGGFQMNLQEMATAVAQELPIIICIFNNGNLGMVRQLQGLFYDQRYYGTCMNYRKSCAKNCLDPQKRCPPYLPDFVAFAESYGAIGIRVTKEEEIASALENAMKNTAGPTLIEFIIDSNELVLPMVQSGKALSDMIIG